MPVGWRCAASRSALLAAIFENLHAQEEALELEQDNYQYPIPQVICGAVGPPTRRALPVIPC